MKKLFKFIAFMCFAASAPQEFSNHFAPWDSLISMTKDAFFEVVSGKFIIDKSTFDNDLFPALVAKNPKFNNLPIIYVESFDRSSEHFQHKFQIHLNGVLIYEEIKISEINPIEILRGELNRAKQEKDMLSRNLCSTSLHFAKLQAEIISERSIMFLRAKEQLGTRDFSLLSRIIEASRENLDLQNQVNSLRSENSELKRRLSGV